MKNNQNSLKHEKFHSHIKMDEAQQNIEIDTAFPLTERVALFLKLYWKSLALIIIPAVFSPLLILYSDADIKCSYVLIIMALFWSFKILPLPVTGMFPIVLFPVLQLMDSKETCDMYMRESILMFLASLMMALGIQHSRLPKRLALKFIQFIGFSHYRLIYGFSFITLLFSMWISNSSVISMMAPIIIAVLKALDENAMGEVFDKSPVQTDESYLSWVTCESYQTTYSHSQSRLGEKVASKTTICYFLTVVYSSCIGSMATIVGNPVNLVFKGIFIDRFPDAQELPAMLTLTIIPVLIMHLLVFHYMLIHFMGWLRPNSIDAQQTCIHQEGNAKIMKIVIDSQYNALGPMTIYEKGAIFTLALTMLLLIFKSPGFVRGWGDFTDDYKFIGTSCVTTSIVLIMILIPLSTDYKVFWDPKKGVKDFPTKQPKGMLTWKYVTKRVYWDLIFVIGGSYALAKACDQTKLGRHISLLLIDLRTMPPAAVIAILVLSSEFLVAVISDVTVANILFPFIAELAIVMKYHPLKLMIPVAMACTFTLKQAISTPAIDIVDKYVFIPVATKIIAGIGPSIICAATIVASAMFYIPFIYPSSNTFPVWAEDIFNEEDLPV